MTILKEQKDFMDNMAEILIKNETLDREELDIIFDCTIQKRGKGTVHYDKCMV